MPTGRKRSPPATRRRALELIAWSPDGMTEAMLLAHGLTVETLVDLNPRQARHGQSRARDGGRALDAG
jgi:hypothetical protein